MASAGPRIAEARSRAATVKRATAVIAVGGFLAVFVLARASHPGNTTAAPQPAKTVLVPATGESDDDGFGFGSGSIAPSQTGSAQCHDPHFIAPTARTFRAMGMDVVVARRRRRVLRRDRLALRPPGLRLQPLPARKRADRVNRAESWSSLSRRSSPRPWRQRSPRPRRPTGSWTRPSAERSRPPATTATCPPRRRRGPARARRAGLLANRARRRPPTLPPSRNELDLNGVVKSLAVDEALALLPGEGFVAAGGDIATRGAAVVGAPGRRRGAPARRRHRDERHRQRRWLAAAGAAPPDRPAHAAGRPPHAGSRSAWPQARASPRTLRRKPHSCSPATGPDWLDERGLPGRFVVGGTWTNHAWSEALPERA